MRRTARWIALVAGGGQGRMSASLLFRLELLAAANLVLLIAIFLRLEEGGSFGEVLRSAGPNLAPRLLAGLGLTGIILAGSIDLSIGAIIVFAATLFGVLAHQGWSPPAAQAACFAAACSLSMWNGFLVRKLAVPAIIVTLAGLPFYRGLALILADLALPGFTGNIPLGAEGFEGYGRLPAGMLLAVLLAAALLWERSAATPRRWLALGNSAEACRLQGLDPERILRSAFFAGGLFLGAAALLETSRLQAIEPARLALGFELEVIGAVVLGGANIFGGEGCYLGTALGAGLLYFLEQLLTYAGISPYYRQVIVGGAIIAVIGADCLFHRRRKLIEELR
jgi:ribose/xylose/arabinose/galactoside ABC-type transport system permease subunit